jgi:hypothetical protein
VGVFGVAGLSRYILRSKSTAAARLGAAAAAHALTKRAMRTVTRALAHANAPVRSPPSR